MKGMIMEIKENATCKTGTRLDQNGILRTSIILSEGTTSLDIVHENGTLVARINIATSGVEWMNIDVIPIGWWRETVMGWENGSKDIDWRVKPNKLIAIDLHKGGE